MLLKMMRRLRDEHDMTFVFSTHDPLVVSYASRVVTLRDGRIVSDERKNSGEPAKNAEGLADARN
jgi:putative ABC transport system ATP-binding protein